MVICSSRFRAQFLLLLSRVIWVFTRFLTHSSDYRIALNNGFSWSSGFMSDTSVIIVELESVKQACTIRPNSTSNGPVQEHGQIQQQARTARSNSATSLYNTTKLSNKPVQHGQTQQQACTTRPNSVSNMPVQHGQTQSETSLYNMAKLS